MSSDNEKIESTLSVLGEMSEISYNQQLSFFDAIRKSGRDIHAMTIGELIGIFSNISIEDRRPTYINRDLQDLIT